MATAMMAAFGLRRCRALSRIVSLATRSNNNNNLISFSAPSRPPFANTIPSLKREISTTNACRRYDESKEETRQILFEGCDYEHWLVTMEFPEPQPSREEKIDTFIKTLAKVVGSEEEAKKRLYALSTTTYTGFQAQISEETSEKLKGLPGVVWVLPDSYIDPVNKEYGGDKYMNGIIVPDTRVYNNTTTRNNQRRPPRNVTPPSPTIQPRNPGLPPPPGQTMNAGLPPPPVQQSHVGPPSPGGHPGYDRPPTLLGGEQNYSRPWSPGQQLPHNMSTPSHSPPRNQPQAGYGMPPPPGNQHGYNMPPPSGNQQSYNASVSSPGNQQGYGQQGQYQQNYSRAPSYDYPPQVYQGQPAATPGYQQGYNTPMQGNNSVPSYQQDYNRAPPQMDNRGQHPDYQQDFRRPPPSQMDQTRPGSYQQNNNWSVPPPGNSTGVVPGNYNRPSPPQPPMSGDYRSPSASPPTSGASHFSNHTQEGQRDPWPMEGRQ